MATPSHTSMPISVSNPNDADKILRRRDFVTAGLSVSVHGLEGITGKDVSDVQEIIRSTLIFLDTEADFSAREAVTQFFSDKEMAAWGPVVDTEITSCLRRLETSENPDLVDDFSDPLFHAVMTRVFGLEAMSESDLISAVRQAQKINAARLSQGELEALAAALIQLKRAIPTGGFKSKHHPRPMAQIMAASKPDAPEGTGPQAPLVALIIAAYAAAQTTAFVLWGLLNREAKHWQNAAQDGWANRHLETLLSQHPSTLALIRKATNDTDIGDAHGCPVHKGQTIKLDIPGINAHLRADNQATNAGRETIAQQRTSMSFGAGAHKCVGEAISRLMISRAAPAIAKRFPRLTLHKERVRFFVTDTIQAPITLPCDPEAISTKATNKMWHVKNYDTAIRIAKDDDAFGPPQMAAYLESLDQNCDADLSVSIKVARNAMFFMSGPRHAIARKEVTNNLGTNRLRAWWPMIDASVQQMLDRLGAAQTHDLVTEFTEPLYRLVTKTILGVNPEDADRFDALAPDLQGILEPVSPLRELLRVQKVFAEMLQMIKEQDTSTMSTGLPGEGPRPVLQALQALNNKDFDDDDWVALTLVLYAASSNLSHALANTLYYLLTLPAEERMGLDQEDWVNSNLEQIIALCASPKYIYRMARKPHTTDNMDFATFDTAQIHLAQVNHGVANGHLSFGHGLHHCVGASLSRLLLRRAIPAFFRRFPTVTLEPQSQQYFDYSQTVALKSLKCRLP